MLHKDENQTSKMAVTRHYVNNGGYTPLCDSLKFLISIIKYFKLLLFKCKTVP